jgi:hypothetical protein
MRRECVQCGRVLDVPASYLPALQAATWVDGDRYVSAEVQGWVVVWDQVRGEWLTACACSRDRMPHHQDTGDVIIAQPTSEKH